MTLTRRTCFTLVLAALMGRPALASARHLDVFSTEGCGCCHAWVKHLEESGYTASVTYLPLEALTQKKREAGLKEGLTSCHTGFIGGYVIEGHVPAREIGRLLAEQPDALGLTVPGMPIGSPGMGDPGAADPYDVLLLRRDGSTVVFAHYS